MKKKLILLPLLAMALTACDLSSLMGNNNNGNGAPMSFEPRSIDPNDAAIKLADVLSIFPEVGDELDMSEYISFDTGTDYRLEQFTFESLNPDVISVSNYRGVCLKEGYAGIQVSGPGLNTPVEVRFFVGSIAGHYVPDSTRLSSIIDLNIVKGEDGYSFTLNVAETTKTFNNREIKPYAGGGTLTKNISPFVPMQFSGEAPSTFEPVTNYLTDLVGDIDEIKDLGQDIYGYMNADAEYGVMFKMRFNESFITFIAQ